MEALAWGPPSKTGREPEEGAALSDAYSRKKRKRKTLKKGPKRELPVQGGSLCSIDALFAFHGSLQYEGPLWKPRDSLIP
ncbi:hypothetical protein CEXT_216451 [Caerostris extrusa]|uniref:Uncharacterized protein n=1 Tax=Caerostris extrusa TaxID=172846 RepID=A0AAV4M568_CAEEX|nr:hypothetical protein CEXT_216451 [Caerostris extrusa]